MSRPSAGRALGVAVLCAFALGASAASALAEDPILGFTDAHSQQQRAYESRYQDGVNPRTIGNTSRALSRSRSWSARTGCGSRSSTPSAAALVRARRLDAELRRLLVAAARRERDDDRAVHAATRHQGARLPVAARTSTTWSTATTRTRPSGDVTGEVVYANYGLPEDYAALEELGVRRRGQDRARPLRQLVPRRQGPAGGEARREGRDDLLRSRGRRVHAGRSTRTARGGRRTRSSAARSSTSSTTPVIR